MYGDEMYRDGMYRDVMYGNVSSLYPLAELCAHPLLAELLPKLVKAFM